MAVENDGGASSSVLASSGIVAAAINSINNLTNNNSSSGSNINNSNNNGSAASSPAINSNNNLNLNLNLSESSINGSPSASSIKKSNLILKSVATGSSSREDIDITSLGGGSINSNQSIKCEIDSATAAATVAATSDSNILLSAASATGATLNPSITTKGKLVSINRM